MQAENSSAANTNVWAYRPMRKDVGVAIVVLASLLFGLYLRFSTQGRVKDFRSPDAAVPFSIAYPANWVDAESLLDAPVLKVENPQANSAFKTSLTVETRELDPTSPPTLQTLLDRRVEQRGSLTGYHFLSNQETTVAGEKAMNFEYAYVVQPIDTPRSASLPVVVHANEYIVITKDRTYYITLAAPESDYANASAQFAQVIQTVKLQ
jgi:hypothetical protein